MTDAHSRAAVAGIRALGAAGVPVLAMATRRGAAGLWSRFASERALGPPPTEPDGFVARIAELALERGPLAVFPGQEAAAAALVAAGSDLPSDALLPYPNGAAVQALRDKTTLAELSATAGIASPAVLDSGRAADITLRPPAAPCVIKARDSSPGAPDTIVCDSAADVEGALAALAPDEPIMVQELARGRLVAVSVVLDREGSVIARFQQQALRLWPATAGASSLGISVEPEQELVERVAALLRAGGYWGLAQVQLLATERGHAAIDVNPRFYGSLPLATAAGVNLPLAWLAAMTGERPPPLGRYRLGVTYRWLEADLTAAYNGDLALLRRRAPRPRVGAMWAADDPLASALLASDAAAARVRRRLGREI